MAAVNGANNSAAQTAVTNATKKILGKDDFLKLMMTQLRYQDPMEPTDNQAFIAQMAQFSSLEQMTNMSSGFEKLASMQESMLRESAVSQALNMIGRTVNAVLPAEGLTGKISAETTKVYMEPDSTSMSIVDISKGTPVTILAKDGDMYEIELANGITGYVDAAAVKVDENKGLTGVVTAMKIVDGVPMVTVNGKDVPISFISEVTQVETQGGAV